MSTDAQMLAIKSMTQEVEHIACDCQMGLDLVVAICGQICEDLERIYWETPTSKDCIVCLDLFDLACKLCGQ